MLLEAFAPTPPATRRRRPRSPRASATASASPAELAAAHGLPGSVSFAAGAAGLPKVVLSHANGSSAEVQLFGACVTSFKQPSGDEVLFVRPDAVWDGSKPVAGGIPVCWPLFGPPPPDTRFAQHGFARTSAWAVLRTSADVNPDYPEPCVTLVLRDDPASRALWPHAFTALLEVTLRRDSLVVALRVRNEGETPFSFSAALHTYLEVVDAGAPSCRVTGLQGKPYLDKAVSPARPPRAVDGAEAVTFGAGLVDRVYLGTDPEALLEVGTGAAVAVENSGGWADTVVWNPHEGVPSWRSFVCVESALTQPLELPPGYDWEGRTKLCVVDL